MRATALAAAVLLACAGPTLATGLIAPARPSFDCASAATAHERLICHDPGLTRDDAALADIYSKAMNSLPPDGRARLADSQRAWIAYSRAICPVPYPKGRGGVWSDTVECLDAEYRTRTGELGGAVRRLGPFAVVRLDALRVVRLGPDDPGARYAGGLAVDQASAAWIAPGSVDGALRAEAERLNAGLLPARLRIGAPRFVSASKAESDEDTMDMSVDATITAVTSVIVTSRIVGWSMGHGTPHGWGYTRYGARWRSDGHPLRAADLFRPGTPWASMVEARINAETHPYSHLSWNEDGRDLTDVELRPDAFAVNAGYVDGYAGGEKIVAIFWADLKPFLSESGQRVVDSLSH